MAHGADVLDVLTTAANASSQSGLYVGLTHHALIALQLVKGQLAAALPARPPSHTPTIWLVKVLRRCALPDEGGHPVPVLAIKVQQMLHVGPIVLSDRPALRVHG
jgi:hypothetical protein